MATAAERGVAFEQQLAALFEAHGYRAAHDVRLVGRSGAEHQLDVYAELDLPLQTVRVVVEAKAHEQPIGKDALLKLQQIVDDLGADRGILATTGAFTPGALAMAAGRNVDLWDRERVARLLGEVALGAGRGPGAGSLGAVAVRPALTLEEAEALVRERAGRRRGGLLARGRGGEGRGGETPGSVALVHETYYELVVDAVELVEERRGLLGRETVRTVVEGAVTVAADTGAVVEVDAAGRLVPTGEVVPDLSADEAEVLAAFGDDAFGRDDLAGLGLRPAKARQLLATLAAKGAVVEAGDGMVARAPGVALAGADATLTARLATEAVQHGAGARSGGGGLARAGLVRGVEALLPEATVRSLRVVLYPLVAYELERPDGSRRQGLLDGITGEERPVAGGLA